MGKTTRLTTEEFIVRAKKIHSERYNYSKTEYTNNHTKVCIICLEHGEFWQTPAMHLKGNGCPKCAKEKNRNNRFDTTEVFINKAKMVHGDKYDYSKVEYVDSYTKVCIICPIHGEFWQTPNSHLQGRGCKKCVNKFDGQNGSHTLESFIEKANTVHGNKYNYSKVRYVDNRTKVCIVCPEHGEFWQIPQNHLHGAGCRECDNERKRAFKKYTTESIIEKFKTVNGDYYDYSKFVYTGIFNKSIVICPKHGIFETTPHDHLKGHGCPMCNQSSLEKEIKDALIENNICFEEQKTFDWLIYKGHQYLDFYIQKYNIAIECQGIQHFKPAYFFTKNYETAEKGFEEIVFRDNNKKKLCEENGINILYFSHKNIFIENKSNITEILDNTNDVIKKILEYEQKSSRLY